jgi:uncharacterized coiled-coil DUF342 family protein
MNYQSPIKHRRCHSMNLSEVGEIFTPLTESIKIELSINKEQRDEWNNRVRKHLDKRNDVNIQVKELISEVQKQKLLRDIANVKVKELKDVRFVKSEYLKSVRIELRDRVEVEGDKPEKKAGPDPRKIKSEMSKLEQSYERGAYSGKKEREFYSKMKELSKILKDAKVQDAEDGIGTLKRNQRDAKFAQAKAHDDVVIAVRDAQEAHDLMMELSEEVDRLRDIANKSQMEVTISKREADIMHNRYVVSLRCIHSMQDIINQMKSGEDGDDRVGISDLMTRLMSGDTLSTDELMSLQRN